MTARHHPSDETLMAWAAGTFPAGPRLVVAIHLDGCRRCRDTVAGFEAIGGALLEAAEPAPMATGAFDALMARIDAENAAPEASTGNRTPIRPTVSNVPTTPDGLALPPRLAHHTVGRWRSLGRALSWSRVEVAGAPDANVILLRIPAAGAAPRHGHTGREFTQVLVGGFTDGRDAYVAGDFDEADETVDHRPLVDVDGECICVAAVEGRLRIHGIGRLLQPFVGL
ncbi:ChrR family anti-sigma-E factor [Pinisolibacter aquiterrae]|uniref:ChrR family anti-sigma-E factor n=1 Tax=Pinisolibacter aquiterrae TaxID=2815579 RepID=UPI001C3C68E2|nr:ChrR family anti-sigma-E factor [Pinisolibacter aquiterrae]MBV5263858.1 cupin domain-containing protein [Pinisolibacter aquiterrae]MCC8237251.1 ChrR family anti-sigma-E factor [Pinisolibacter aquiterrae]